MKPVAWMVDGVLFTSLGAALNISFDIEQPCIPLYTAPRELSDEEITDVFVECLLPDGEFNEHEFARAILKKASEK